MSPVLFSSKSCEHETPQALFDDLNLEFGFTLDVAATKANAKCARYFTREQNGLHKGWGKDVCWMNPPYGREIGKWIEKAYVASMYGATVVCLVPARTDTRWWHRFVLAHAEIRFIRGRLKFGKAKNAAPFPSAVCIFWPFSGLGDGRAQVRN